MIWGLMVVFFRDVGNTIDQGRHQRQVDIVLDARVC